MTTDSPAATSAAVVALPSLAVVDVRGADAATFLQGQLSNDLLGGAAGGAGRACLAGYCNPKGRLLALPLVLPLGAGALRMVVPRELAESLLQRLRMFVLRADVVFEPRETLHCHGLPVPAERGADEPLAHGFAALPTTAPEAVLDVLGGAEGAEEAQICRWHDASLPYPCRRYLIVAAAGPADARATLDDGQAPGGGEPDGEAVWRLGDISGGIPRIVAATREAFVPQMVNLQLVDGLSFRKGCYPGQEIVARMQYLGKLKRHMRRFVATFDEAAPATAGRPAIAPGEAIAAGEDGDAGRVVDAVATAAGVELLAVVKVGASAGTLRAGGATLAPRPLPYALSDAEAEPMDGVVDGTGDGTGDGAGADAGEGATAARPVAD